MTAAWNLKVCLAFGLMAMDSEPLGMWNYITHLPTYSVWNIVSKLGIKMWRERRYLLWAKKFPSTKNKVKYMILNIVNTFMNYICSRSIQICKYAEDAHWNYVFVYLLHFSSLVSCHFRLKTGVWINCPEFIPNRTWGFSLRTSPNLIYSNTKQLITGAICSVIKLTGAWSG